MGDNRKKRILYFMPDNPFSNQAGNLTRTKQLLKYFEQHETVLEIDFLSCLYWNKSSVELFKNTYPNVNLNIVDIYSNKSNRLKYLVEDKIPRLIYKAIYKPKISLLTPIIIKRIKSLLQGKSYDIIVISYSTWGALAAQLSQFNAYTIIDTHDFMTLQRMREKTNFDIGAAFKEEMAILSLYNEIWTYSIEERYIYEQFLKKKVTLLPVSVPDPKSVYNHEKSIDILYVASDNIHNIESMMWFIDSVLPFLPLYKIHVVGKICTRIPDHPQLTKVGIVDDLEVYYAGAKITICPMLSGTGIKIKVLESLCHGLPVVTTQRGIDGLVNKINNGCVVANDEIHFAHAIIDLLEDNVFYKRQSEYARVFYKSFYACEYETRILDRVFLDAKSI
ncbi:glycosyltransferase family 4 protein [Sphingobacterium sp. ML3W]|uniref:glycosyltransferase n=1 Tax=Sphingobacterium sp. ML3W TaxID=1538644 RepID=UPI002499EBBE|nr:glycosyltransferase [Sphingobacterium sp. ML3W]WFA78897.1 glycosyltransferase family 4 protein [Sphingobacterium sp. ML3W]